MLKEEIVYVHTNELPSMDYLMELMKLWIKNPKKYAHLKPLMQGDTTLPDYFIN